MNLGVGWGWAAGLDGAGLGWLGGLGWGWAVWGFVGLAVLGLAGLGWAEWATLKRKVVYSKMKRKLVYSEMERSFLGFSLGFRV